MKYGKKRLLLPLILVGLTIIFFLSNKALAQTANNYDVTISPIFFDLSANPGDTVSTKIRIRNNTSNPIPLKLGVQRLVGDENGNLTLKQDKNDYTLSWVKTPSDTVVMKPLEWTDVPFTIEVPKDAAFGYYWTITFTQDVTSKYARNGVSLTGAAAVPILLNVRKEGAKAAGQIKEFSVGNFISEYLPVDFKVKIENLGNIHIRPHGNIFIRNGGKDLAVLDVNSSLGSILPNSARVFTTSWNDSFIVNQPVMEAGQPKLDKNGKPITHLVFNWNKLTSFRIGRYTANLLVIFDNGQRDIPLEATATFFVLPYKAIIGAVLFLIVAFFIFRWLIRRYISKEIQKRTKSS